MPYIRLSNPGNRYSTITRYISQTPSGVVFSQAQATNFPTKQAARDYMRFAYPATQIVTSGAFSNQRYHLEETSRIDMIPTGNPLTG